jgi:ketosteroid isomerase-like protein
MSEENVEIVRRVYAALSRRDAASVLALYDPEVEFYFSPGTLVDHIGGGGTYRGHEGLRAFDRDLRQTFEDFETNCEELIDSEKRIISVSRYRARGRGGIEVDGPLQFGVWTIQGDKIARVAWFAALEEALEAARLSE